MVRGNTRTQPAEAGYYEPCPLKRSASNRPADHRVQRNERGGDAVHPREVRAISATSAKGGPSRPKVVRLESALDLTRRCVRIGDISSNKSGTRCPGPADRGHNSSGGIPRGGSRFVTGSYAGYLTWRSCSTEADRRRRPYRNRRTCDFPPRIDATRPRDR